MSIKTSGRLDGKEIHEYGRLWSRSTKGWLASPLEVCLHYDPEHDGAREGS